MKRALIPGSFDPMTKGHVLLVERAAKIFDEVVVAVMINENKEYLFSMEERVKIARASLSHIENVRVISYSGWLYELFDETGADVIVKGIRNERDLAYENEMAIFNLAKNKRAYTMYIPADEEMACVSSTAFRENIGGSADEYIYPSAAELVRSLLEGKNKY